MIYLYHDSLDAYFNLAAEEYLLKECSDEVFMLWRNENTVVVGKNQNTLSEIDPEYVRTHDISVVRRLTGGGAVFHDRGNVNYTFIVDGSEHMTDFGFFTAPIIEALAGMGVKAELSGRNDLLIDGKKFSGNAQCTMGGRTLHHGTLMLSAGMEKLVGALRVDPEKIESKGIRSVASRVTNIDDHLDRPISPEEFIARLRDSILRLIPGIEERAFTEEDNAAIRRLRNEKYATWEWNYGYSPAYGFHKKTRFSKGTLEVFLDVKEGVIRTAALKGDYFGSLDVSGLENKLVGLRHEYDCLLNALATENVDRYIWGMDAIALTQAMF
ncbi:MAG: lipoate--protein ligase [Eubacteriales bacterium]|nr:lipoate--protein ligase [Eubacteriales bacterium]